LAFALGNLSRCRLPGPAGLGEVLAEQAEIGTHFNDLRFACLAYEAEPNFVRQPFSCPGRVSLFWPSWTWTLVRVLNPL
jgi:hypothetical protein